MCHGRIGEDYRTLSRAGALRPCFTLPGVTLHVTRFRTRRSVVAAASLAAVAVASLPAGATSTASHGRATSSLTILSLRIAGQSVSAGHIVAVAGNSATPHVARL